MHDAKLLKSPFSVNEVAQIIPTLKKKKKKSRVLKSKKQNILELQKY